MLVKQGTQLFDTTLYNEIPNLWHIAQAHPDPMAREAILKAWHIAHAYRKALTKLQGDAPSYEMNVTGL